MIDLRVALVLPSVSKYCWSMFTTESHDQFLRLIGRLAADVQDTYTIREHLDALTLPPSMHAKVLAEVLECYRYAESGYDDWQAFLDQHHYTMGTSHLRFVEDLRDWACEHDPRLADDGFIVNSIGYAYARKRPSQRTHALA